MPPPRVALVTAALVGLLVAGCGGKVIDDKKAESFIKGQSGGLASSVNCPSGVDAKEGTSFSCSMNLKNGARRKVTMDIANVSGDTVELRFARSQPQK